ncbi:hypothetical protein CC53_gp181 [Rhizobium phage vB_RleS_L338C]|uniref:hypothetical protein n=1 Tax=Rhizobium phage vB_RleS_L338C TaxID=1414737 RepID=UPI0003D93147|nr:hypothetical protein CC53_gp181 [Rhizobium phage vB_RleS_L338C]AHC30598.1 hypothetical protein L338C_181 [Rhizobium phage vB_RleS_L338C]QNH72072.1 hypothetical protein P11VFA_137 [Rhizobium phage P11VFA]
MQEVPFRTITVAHDGKHRTAFEIACCKCVKTMTVIRPTHLRQAKRIEVENKTVASAMEEAGWTYKNGFRRCMCPDHPKITAIEESAPVAAVTREIAQKEEEKEAAPFRQPDLRQRRQILEDLDMVYDVDKGCYKKGNNDDTIAKKRNYPRKWVVDIREQFFGLNEKSEDHAEVLQTVKSMHEQIGIIEARMFSDLEKLDKFKTELGTLLTNLAK